MYIVYCDESGDDGYPNYSSPFFILTSVYLHYLSWKDNYDLIYKFRQQLKKEFHIPIKWEFHTKYFLTNKKPFRQLNLSDDTRIQIISLFCEFLSQLDLKIINVVINKQSIKTDRYNVLDRALTYSVQRIENDLKRIDPTRRFLIITDEGRAGKMRKTTRKIQRINFIPSKFGQYAYRQEIKMLIEDPLPKSSKESYFIQISDLVAFIIYLYAITKLRVGKFHNRLPKQINSGKVLEWLQLLKNILNLEASSEDEFGVVIYPK